jgi:hypothetical protein
MYLILLMKRTIFNNLSAKPNFKNLIEDESWSAKFADFDFQWEFPPFPQIIIGSMILWMFSFIA